MKGAISTGAHRLVPTDDISALRSTGRTIPGDVLESKVFTSTKGQAHPGGSGEPGGGGGVTTGSACRLTQLIKVTPAAIPTTTHCLTNDIFFLRAAPLQYLHRLEGVVYKIFAIDSNPSRLEITPLNADPLPYLFVGIQFAAAQTRTKALHVQHTTTEHQVLGPVVPTLVF